METTKFLEELVKLSPYLTMTIVAVVTLWKSNQAKDVQLLALMQDTIRVNTALTALIEASIKTSYQHHEIVIDKLDELKRIKDERMKEKASMRKDIIHAMKEKKHGTNP